jgi:transcriptional regulator with XRE-family HTH domain
MATRARASDTGKPTGPIPKNAAKQIFKNKIYEHILDRGWNNSDMARAAGISRDDVHRYVKGISLPTEGKLRAIAKVMRIEPEELLPNFIASTPSADLPRTSLTEENGEAWLIINRAVRLETGLAILGMLRKDDEAHGPTGRR